MQHPVNVFFMGKGGVGKSTSSAIYSISMAKAGHKVALISMDPAHNLSDIFNKQLSNRPSTIHKGLTAMEVDQEAWVKVYLRSVSRQIKKSYSYLTSFNLESYFDVIQFSPGLEEYALILAFQKIRRDFRSHDYLVFDMPPTALSLKFLFLPSLSLVWTEKLLALRREIIEKRNMITRIKLIRKERETDKVLNTIEEQKVYFTTLKDTFEDPETTRINLVLNPDKLSFAESERILARLKTVNIPISRIIFNKTRNPEAHPTLEQSFPGIAVNVLPLSDTALNGYEILETFLTVNNITFI
ncbi:MAG: ArsA family ATPase [bacterium]